MRKESIELPNNGWFQPVDETKIYLENYRGKIHLRADGQDNRDLIDTLAACLKKYSPDIITAHLQQLI